MIGVSLSLLVGLTFLREVLGLHDSGTLSNFLLTSLFSAPLIGLSIKIYYRDVKEPYYEDVPPLRDESNAQIPGTVAWCCSPLSMTGPNSFNRH
ncbi:MAG TPA: hypothetical protein VI959_03655 [Alphaproteobacteria bacterium]|nr:hypothetical protein [Alphaproteobacteria bacterium]